MSAEICREDIMTRNFVRTLALVFGVLCVFADFPCAEESDDLQIPAVEIVPEGIRLKIGYGDDFSNDVDIFACTDLLERDWQLVATNLQTTGANFIIWADTDQSNYSARFYIIGNTEDFDNDGLASGREYLLYRSDPFNADTDKDGMPDGWEVAYGLKPFVDDSGSDLDGDGLTNLEEFKLGADPHYQSDGQTLLESARVKIINRWYMVMSTDLVFTNAPGSTADLADLKDALNTLFASGKLYGIEEQ